MAPLVASQARNLAMLLEYTRDETCRWHRWFSANPDALDITVGFGRLETVRDVIIHIFAVELRCSERLLAEPVTSLEALPTDSLTAIWGISSRARDKLSLYLSASVESDLERIVTIPDGYGRTMSASARRIVSHILIHGIRHWAQIATVLRQDGQPDQWPHDFLSASAL